MIPPDVASALRQSLPDLHSAANQPQTQPLVPAQRIADVLGDLVPGQRILAEIQALLPNGSYRAVVAQRDITLALPFSAKAGDSLELEVTETDGKLTLAFVANRGQAATPGEPQSVSTSLSSAGKLIGNILQGLSEDGKNSSPAPLNGNHPLISVMPKDGTELAPVLKNALAQSGIFYEAHQARWVAGELPVEALLQEPQGKLKPHSLPATVNPNLLAKSEAAPMEAATPQATPQNTSANSQAAQPTSDGQIPKEVAVLVRQQLDGLATNNFAWQGQIWPGQQMRWEIGEHSEQRAAAEPVDSPEWQSRLKLALPSLGDIDATLRLQAGGRISLALSTTTKGSEDRLREHTDALLNQFSAAGLDLTQLQISHGKPDA